jgi:hypothetical protein
VLAKQCLNVSFVIDNEDSRTRRENCLQSLADS